MKTKNKGLQLGARFALPPNSLGYCGKNSAPERFKKCVTKDNCAGVEEEFSKFIVLHPYLETISHVTGLSQTSYKVNECYWIGNSLLNNFKAEHYNLLLKNFLKQGVPKWLVTELKQKKPKIFIPHHLFQVLHVGVGKASGSVPFNLDTINNCMVRWGNVIAIKNGFVTADFNSISKIGSKYALTVKKEAFPTIPGFITNLKTGDTVAVHWKQIVKALTKTEVRNIAFWTNKVLDSVG